MIIVKTKETLFKEGWKQDDGGNLFNDKYDPDIGYFLYIFRDLLGKKLKVIKQTEHFFLVNPTFFNDNICIPKIITKKDD